MQTEMDYSIEEIKAIFKLYPEICLIPNEKMKSHMNNLKQVFDFSDEEVKQILMSYPPAIEPDFYTLHKFNVLLKESLYNNEGTPECKEIIFNAPFILTIEYEKVSKFILFLLNQKFTGFGLRRIFLYYPLFLYGTIGKLINFQKIFKCVLNTSNI